MRQGTHGDTFYIISEGQVRVTKRVEGKQNQKPKSQKIFISKVPIKIKMLKDPKSQKIRSLKMQKIQNLKIRIQKM